MKKYLFCRRIMYMGEHKGNAVYIDLKRNIPLEAKKSKLLDIETARKHNKWTVYLSLLLTTILGSLSFKWISDSGNNGLRIYKISFCISFISSFLLLIIVYRALYKDVRYAKPTTRAVFASAMKGNSAWDANKGYGKVKKRTYLIYFLAQLIMPFSMIYSLFFGYDYLVSGGDINILSEVKDIITVGAVPPLGVFATILLWRLNNPIAFFRCASKYQNRKLFDKDVNKIAKKYEEEELMDREKAAEKNNILPLGSVVLLKDGDGTQLEIVCRGIAIEEDGDEFYYDYGAVLIPDGLVSPEAVYFFNIENVEEVVFKGYVNEEEEEYARNYHQKMKDAGITKGSV